MEGAVRQTSECDVFVRRAGDAAHAGDLRSARPCSKPPIGTFGYLAGAISRVAGPERLKMGARAFRVDLRLSFPLRPRFGWGDG